MPDTPGPTVELSGPIWDVFRYESKRLLDAFTEASTIGSGTSQEIADFREQAFRDVVGRFFPAPHMVTKGQVLGVDGTKSASIDCVVLNPVHPHTVDSGGKFKLIFADGVDFTVEVKGRLDGKELTRLLEQCQSLKKVMRSLTPLLFSNSPERDLAARRIPFLAYCHESALTPQTIASHVREWVADNNVPPEERPDAIGIHGSGIYLDSSVPASVGRSWLQTGPPDRTQHWYKSGELTLGAMIVLMSSVTSAVLPMVQPILLRYVAAIPADDWFALGEYPDTTP